MAHRRPALQWMNWNQKCPQCCLEFHDRLWEALSGTTSEKRSVPSRTGGERILEMLWSLQMPWIIGLGGSQPFSFGLVPSLRGTSLQTLSGCRIRGLSLRGVAFMTVLAVLESTLPSLSSPTKYRTKRWRFWRFRRSWRYPPYLINSNPVFRHPDNRGGMHACPSCVLPRAKDSKIHTCRLTSTWDNIVLRSRFLGRGCEEALFSEFFFFSEKGEAFSA